MLDNPIVPERAPEPADDDGSNQHVSKGYQISDNLSARDANTADVAAAVMNGTGQLYQISDKASAPPLPQNGTLSDI